MFKINCMLGLILIAQFTMAPAQSDDYDYDDPYALVSTNIELRSNGHKYILKPVYVKHIGPKVGDASLIDVIKSIVDNVNNVEDATSAPSFHIDDSSSQESDELNQPYITPMGSVLPNVQKKPNTHVHSLKHYFRNDRPINQIDSNGIDQIVVGKRCLGLPCSTYDRLLNSLKQNKMKKVQKLDKISSQAGVPQKVAKSYVYTLN